MPFREREESTVFTVPYLSNICIQLWGLTLRREGTAATVPNPWYTLHVQGPYRQPLPYSTCLPQRSSACSRDLFQIPASGDADYRCRMNLAQCNCELPCLTFHGARPAITSTRVRQIWTDSDKTLTIFCSPAMFTFFQGYREAIPIIHATLRATRPRIRAFLAIMMTFRSDIQYTLSRSPSNRAELQILALYFECRPWWRSPWKLRTFQDKVPGTSA